MRELEAERLRADYDALLVASFFVSFALTEIQLEVQNIQLEEEERKRQAHMQQQVCQLFHVLILNGIRSVTVAL